MLILGTVAFRGTEIGSLNTTIDLILNLLKGAYIPAFLFPASVIAFLKLTPIYYLNAFPIDVYQGKVNLGEFIWGFLIICIWIISLSWIFGKLFKKGLLSYEAYGS
jgi:ABC-type uncharacterized transport system permease subunit